MEDDIQHYLPTVMFRGTPCTNLRWSRKKLWWYYRTEETKSQWLDNYGWGNSRPTCKQL